MIFVINTLSEIGDINKDLSHDRCCLTAKPPIVNPSILLTNQYQETLLQIVD